MAVSRVVRGEVELDEFELRIDLTEATTDALDLADRMVERIGQFSADPELSALAANFMQQRTRMRRLQTAIRVAVAG